MEAPVLISNFYFPKCMMCRVLLEASTKLSDVSVWRLVCQVFKQIADDSSFLHPLLVKIKGQEFSGAIYTRYPNNFLALDKDLTQIFKSNINKKSKPNERLKKISSIALNNIETRIFILKIKNETVYYQFSKEEVGKLNEINCFNRPEWKACLDILANQIANYKFPLQIKLFFPNNFPYLSRIEAAHSAPDLKMNTLINNFKITDIFTYGDQFLIINTCRDNPAKRSKLNEIILQPESTDRLFCKYDMQFFVNENKWLCSLGNDSNERIGLVSTLLKETNGEKKAHKNTLPYASFLGLLMPQIWEIWRDRKRNSGLTLRYWSTKICTVECCEEPKFQVVTKTDSTWRGLKNVNSSLNSQRSALSQSTSAH